jgi:hypothetical protein
MSKGDEMSDRSWFFATEGQQRGPFSDTQLRELIERGMVGPDTPVWSAGMSEWTRAGDVPGLLRNATGSAPFDQIAGRSHPSLAGGSSPRNEATRDGMPGLEVSLGRLLRIYWLFVWRSLLGSLVIGFVLGFIAGFVLGVFGAKTTQIQTVGGALGVIGGAIWSFFCLRMALTKKYRDFRIVLVPHEAEATKP